MYLRFTTTNVHPDSKKPEGVFAAAYRLRDSGDLDSIERERLRDILIWFQQHLPRPPSNFDASRAIFWFRSTAAESIAQIWELVQILREHRHHVAVHRCSDLANICYQDDCQVAAHPSDRDGKITTR
jgi:hypothetical protein